VKIVMPGGTGQIGRVLARAFHQDGHDVAVFSRRPAHLPWRVVTWDGRTEGGWTREIDGADVVINLTGKSVNCRYTAANKEEILRSRVDATRIVGATIAAAHRPPALWMNASAATIYTHRFDGNNDEHCGALGGPNTGMPDAWLFSIDVIRAWEAEFNAAKVPGTRKVTLRTSLMMSPDQGGVFNTLVGLVRAGLGGRLGDGRQFMSWIHDEDLVSSVRWLIDRTDIDGVVNIASPCPLPNAEFMRDLRRAFGMPCGLPAERWMLEIGAVLLQTETELMLKSRRVVPGRMLDHGFVFRYPQWKDAARELAARWKANRRLAAPAA